MRCSGRSTRPVIFCDERLAPAEDVAADVDELVGVRGVRQVVGGEDQRLGEAAVLALVLVGVLLDLLEDLAVGVGRGDLALDLGGVELPLVLQQVELLAAGLGVDQLDCSPSLRKTPFMRTSDLIVDDVVVDEVALADGPLVLVAVDEVVEVGHGVGGRRGGQADLDGVEVVERVAPDRQLGGGVAAVALVGDDQVEGVDRDVELLGVVVDRLVADAEDGLAGRTG